MADPITILSLVASVITFVDFGYKVISGSNSVRSSVKGMTVDVTRLDDVVEEIRRLNNSVTAQLAGRSKLTKLEEHVLDMVREAELVNTRLRREIKKLTMRTDPRFKHLESGRVAIQSLWSHKDLQILGKELVLLDQRIQNGLQMILQLDQHSSVMSRLKELERSQQKLGMVIESNFDQIKASILKLTRREEQRHLVQIADQGAQLVSLKAKVDALLKEHSESSRAVQVVRSLYFSEVRRRFDQIPTAEGQSNDWIYDKELTEFASWLEHATQDDGIFYIWGKPGSGKSTLTKQISEDSRTRAKLKLWAGAEKLYIGSYFFWNQGTKMQKSRAGLMQSLLYQILRTAPELIPSTVGDRLHHEVWETKDMIMTFERIAVQTRHHAKFCFFIDGLDEYNGDENDVEPMLKTLSSSPHLKICASSRPGRLYESSELWSKSHAFDIAKFTKGDMRQYVQTRLSANAKYQCLATQGPECEKIIADISEYADGVWLWVFLVTRDILYEVDRDEGVSTLSKIVHEFPSDLEKYFERIVKRIKVRHKEEMAQTFLITIHELQPLPLYAFALLEQERIRSNYALDLPIQRVAAEEIEPQYPVWQARVRNRCGDLLVVDPEPHPVYLSHSVDFMHRTVRDFLRDCYHDQLMGQLKAKLNPLVSLCKIHLSLLKALPVSNFRDRKSVNRIIGLTDEFLYYAHEAEKNSSAEEQSMLNSLLDDLDVVNSHHARSIQNHWTHARDSPARRGFDEYREGGQCNFLALTIQARLVKYVGGKLQTDKQLMQKRGRPLLDYALRPLRSTPISMDYHTSRDDPSVDVNMVELLLSSGADPDQPVHLFDDESVWALFLLSIYETNRKEESSSAPLDSLKNAWYASCEAMVMAGAQSDHRSPFVRQRADLTTSSILHRVFGSERAQRLEEQIEFESRRRERDKSQEGNSCVVM